MLTAIRNKIRTFFNGECMTCCHYRVQLENSMAERMRLVNDLAMMTERVTNLKQWMSKKKHKDTKRL